MIEKLELLRFKSIRELRLTCRKVNVFIGAPDSGKTNILEALQFLSRVGWNWPIDTSLRISPEQGFDALFHRQFFDEPFEIGTDHNRVKAKVEGSERALHCTLTGDVQASWSIAFGKQIPGNYEWLRTIRYYSYTSSRDWNYQTAYPLGTEVITTPHGWNLMYIARHHQRIYDFLKDLVAELNWKLRFDSTSKRFVMSEVREDDIIDYNLDLLSDSIKRFFFFGAIVLSSSNASLVFDEPDVQAFPPYPKLLGRMIAEDETNQFFLTTHNPYFLGELAEKTPSKDLGIFVCHRAQDGDTAARMLTESEVQQVIDLSANVFFNLDKFGA